MKYLIVALLSLNVFASDSDTDWNPPTTRSDFSEKDPQNSIIKSLLSDAEINEWSLDETVSQLYDQYDYFNNLSQLENLLKKIWGKTKTQKRKGRTGGFSDNW